MSALVGANIGSVVVRVIGGALVATLITVIALRLLGIRRGWVSAFFAGVVGWGLTIVVALGVNHWNWGADGLVLHLLAIGIPITMTVAVAFDLLARPGSLASSERAGLVIAPRPFRAVGRRIAVLRRYRELIHLARREGFGPMLTSNERAERTVDSQAVRLRRVLEAAGGVYIKLGQIAATRVDLLPVSVCEELARLQQQVPPESRERIESVLEAEFGPDLDATFAEFDWEPLAAASIGQTHRAQLKSGEAVVVKIQRPGIEETMERDLAALGLLADLAQRRTPLGRGIRSGDTLEQFARSLRAELDFRREADAMVEMAERLDPKAGVRVPTVFRELCSRRSPRPGAVRGTDRRRFRPPRRRGVRPRVARRPVASFDPRPGHQHRVLPCRPSSRKRVRVEGRHARSDRLRRHRPARLDPAEGDHRHHVRDGTPGRAPDARRRRAGHDAPTKGCPPTSSSTRLPGCWRITCDPVAPSIRP